MADYDLNPALIAASNDDIYIAIMGVTGAGKSSLIARLTKQNINIGHNLLSCLP
jgi:predicted GTPase